MATARYAAWGLGALCVSVFSVPVAAGDKAPANQCGPAVCAMPAVPSAKATPKGPAASAALPIASNGLARYDENRMATVAIRDSEDAMSSGFVLTTSGYILTAQHVIADGGPWRVETESQVNGVRTAKTHEATFVAASAKYDLAVLKVAETLPSAVRFAPASLLIPGMLIYTVSYPLDLGQATIRGYVMNDEATFLDGRGEPYYTGSILSADFHITKGNSGGVTLDDRYGLVVGMVDMFTARYIMGKDPRVPPIQYVISGVITVRTIVPFLERHHIPYLLHDGAEKKYVGNPPTLEELLKIDPTEGPPSPRAPLTAPMHGPIPKLFWMPPLPPPIPLPPPK